MNNFKDFTKGLGWAAASLTTAVIGVSVTSLAASNAVTAIVAPAIIALAYEASKDMMKESQKHMQEVFHGKDDKVSATSELGKKYLS